MNCNYSKELALQIKTMNVEFFPRNQNSKINNKHLTSCDKQF